MPADEHDAADPRLRLRGLEEIARILGTDWRNVRDWVEAGDLPCRRVGASREPKVALATLEAWLVRLGEAGAERLTLGNPGGNSPRGTTRHDRVRPGRLSSATGGGALP